MCRRDPVRPAADPSPGELRARLAEAEQMLEAIRDGLVDAVMIRGARGEQVYTLSGADRVYRQLVEAMGEGTGTLSTDGAILFANARLVQMIGRPADTLLGSPLREHLSPGDRAGLESALAQAGSAPGAFDASLLTGAGAAVPVRLSLSGMHGDTPEPAFGLVVTDLTEQKARHEQLVAAERAARESRQQLDSIVMSAMDAIVTVDEDQRIVLFNAAAERMFGYAAKEIHGQPLDVLIPPRLRAAHAGHMQGLRGTSGVVAARSVRGLRRNGEEFSIEASLSRVEWGGRHFFTAIARDVSERMALQAARDRADQELRQLNAELDRRVLERTAELEAANKDLQAFSSSVSHDLRAPLRAVDSFCSLLQQDHAAQLDAEGLRLLAVVRKKVNDMGRLIEDLLNFSRAGAADLRPVTLPLEPLAREVFAEIPPANGRRAAFTVAPLPPALADPALMRQVLANLLANAVKFSGKRSDPAIAMTGRVEGDEVVYEITDNGVGFDPRYAGKLFGICRRLHGADEFPGTGFGLSIVKRIVTKHGGRVWAEGRPGAGATFGFSLPRREAPGGPHAGNPP